MWWCAKRLSDNERFKKYIREDLWPQFMRLNGWKLMRIHSPPSGFPIDVTTFDWDGRSERIEDMDNIPYWALSSNDLYYWRKADMTPREFLNAVKAINNTQPNAS